MNERIEVWSGDQCIFAGTEAEVCEYLLDINPRMGGMSILRPHRRLIGAAAWFFSDNRFRKAREDKVYKLIEAALSTEIDLMDEIKAEARSTTDAILKLFRYQ